MPELTLSFDVYCGTCGAGLCGQSSVDDRRKSISVEACQNCMDKARDAGYDEGYESGMAIAEENHES